MNFRADENQEVFAPDVDAIGQTDPTLPADPVNGPMSGVQYKKIPGCSFSTRTGLKCILQLIGFDADAAGDGYLSFDLVIDGIPHTVYRDMKSSVGSILHPRKVYIPLPQGARVEVWCRNSDTVAANKYNVAAMMRAVYLER